MTDEFITHNSTEPPELPPAVLVEWKLWIDGELREATLTVDQTPWLPGLEYRVLRNPDGHPYVSAEGLEPNTRYVATDSDGEVSQWETRPTLPEDHPFWCSSRTPMVGLAPAGFRHPGDWRDSLCAVWRGDDE